jgi:uncharacterized protein (DUF302 family)
MSSADSPLNLVRGPATQPGWARLIRLGGDRVAILVDELRKSVGRIDGVVQRMHYSATEEKWVVQYAVGGVELFTVRISPGVLEANMALSQPEAERLLQNRTLSGNIRGEIKNKTSEAGSSPGRFLLKDRRTVRSFVNLARARTNLISNTQELRSNRRLGHESTKGQVSDMIFQVKARKSLSDVRRDLEAATQRHKFGIMGTYDLKAKMEEKGVEFDRDCLIVEVCNPHQAKKVLEKNAEISTALPCRISVYREGDAVVLATIRPTAMLELFETSGLESVAKEVEAAILAIMQEAAQ